MSISVEQIYRNLKVRIGYQEGLLFGFLPDNSIGSLENYLFDTPRGYWTTPDKDFPTDHS